MLTEASKCTTGFGSSSSSYSNACLCFLSKAERPSGGGGDIGVGDFVSSALGALSSLVVKGYEMVKGVRYVSVLFVLYKINVALLAK